MNLHRVSGKSDWENVVPAKRNVFQKVAAATKGIVSPANVITVVGLGIVIYGLGLVLQQQFWPGLILLVVGRLLDIADGLVADATQTKSAIGELFDAAADKIGTLLTIVVLILAGITYWWVIVALVLPQVIIPLVILYKKYKGIKVHPTRQGKLSMAATWAGIPGLLLLKALHEPIVLVIAVYGVITVSLVLGLYALWQYATGRD
jgi:phosphatidylglycerophosphate synthase